MKIEAHLLHWQEKDIMPYVVKHYKSFCDELIIHDNHSKDGSAEMAKEFGCTVIPFGGQFFDDDVNRDVKNNAWKGSDADWIIFADFDELLISGFAINNYNGVHSKGVTILKTRGWQIMSDDWPVERLTEITNGFEFSNYAKSIAFKPKEISEINYGPGAHECNPIGNVVWSSGDHQPYVLHYKHIGGVQRTINRYRVLQRRLSKNNRKKGYGCHYNRTPASIRQEWNERMKISRPLI